PERFDFVHGVLRHCPYSTMWARLETGLLLCLDSHLLPGDGADGQRVRPAAALLERRRGDAVGAGFFRREDDARIDVVRCDIVVLGHQLAGRVHLECGALTPLLFLDLHAVPVAWLRETKNKSGVKAPAGKGPFKVPA